MRFVYIFFDKPGVTSYSVADAVPGSPGPAAPGETRCIPPFPPAQPSLPPDTRFLPPAVIPLAGR